MTHKSMFIEFLTFRILYLICVLTYVPPCLQIITWGACSSDITPRRTEHQLQPAMWAFHCSVTTAGGTAGKRGKTQGKVIWTRWALHAAKASFKSVVLPLTGLNLVVEIIHSSVWGCVCTRVGLSECCMLCCLPLVFDIHPSITITTRLTGLL